MEYSDSEDVYEAMLVLPVTEQKEQPRRIKKKTPKRKRYQRQRAGQDVSLVRAVFGMFLLISIFMIMHVLFSNKRRDNEVPVYMMDYLEGLMTSSQENQNKETLLAPPSLRGGKRDGLGGTIQDVNVLDIGEEDLEEKEEDDDKDEANVDFDWVWTYFDDKEPVKHLRSSSNSLPHYKKEEKVRLEQALQYFEDKEPIDVLPQPVQPISQDEEVQEFFNSWLDWWDEETENKGPDRKEVVRDEARRYYSAWTDDFGLDEEEEYLDAMYDQDEELLEKFYMMEEEEDNMRSVQEQLEPEDRSQEGEEWVKAAMPQMDIE